MDMDYKYLRTGPEDGWKMSKDIYVRCPVCGHYMSMDPDTSEVCPCGNMKKDADAGRFRADTGDASIGVYAKASDIFERTAVQPTHEFQSLITTDLPTYREFMSALLNTIASRTIIEWFAIVYLTAYILTISLSDPFNMLVLFTVVLLIYGITKWTNRGGGVAYKRMVSNNNGQIPRNIITIANGKLHVRNPDNGNTICFDFDQVRKISETKNLIVILLDLKQGIMLDKRTLTGGTQEEVLNYLLSNCPKLKRRKVKKDKGHVIRKRIILVLMVLGLILSAIQWISGGEAFGRYGYVTYGETPGIAENPYHDMSYEEIRDNLESLGIEGITDEMVDMLQKEWDQYPEDYRLYLDKTANLLMLLGCGTYDTETWEWTPSSADVYAFDMEFLNVDTMYTEFLRGVAALGGGDLDFTNIEENLDKVDWENGTGSRSVKFEWRGTNGTLGAEMMNDWFDLNFADDLNILIAARCNGKQLYFGSDGYQMIYVFYCDPEWAASFEAATGMNLSGQLNG